MAPTDNYARHLMELRRALEAEMEAVRNKLAGVELACARLGVGVDALTEASAATRATAAAVSSILRGDCPQARAQRGDVKHLLLEMLQEAGCIGLNAQSAVRAAACRGIRLDRNTASSLLSRFKKYGVVAHDGVRYRLKEFAKPHSEHAA